MPKFGKIETLDPPIVAFYDTDAYAYPEAAETIPGDWVPLSDQDWALRLTASRWTITAGRLVAVDPSQAQLAGQAVADALAQGIVVTSTSNPSLNAVYALDPTTLDQIGSVARDYGSGLGLPGGASNFTYPDQNREPHAFTGPQIVGLYIGMRNLLLSINTQGAIMRAGGPGNFPSNAVTIP